MTIEELAQALRVVAANLGESQVNFAVSAEEADCSFSASVCVIRKFGKIHKEGIVGMPVAIISA